MKKLLSMVLTLSVALSLTACGNSEQVDNGPKKVVVWSMAQEVVEMIEEYELSEKLGFEIEAVFVPNEVFQTKIDPVLASGKNAPDVFTLEAGFIKKYVDSGFLADMDALGIDTSNTFEYTLDVARDTDGTLHALSYQAAPGAFFYRRSLADQFFGLSNPEEFQAIVSNFDNFLDAARVVKEKSNGQTYMLSSLGDLLQVYYSARTNPWVKDDQLVIDPVIYDLLETARIMKDEKLVYGADQWSEGWFAGMNSNTVFGYLLPTWGLPYVLKENATNADGGNSTAGDWGMVTGPSSYFWGGTWLTVREGSKVSEEAAQLVEYITTNEDFLRQFAKDRGDFVSNKNIVDEYKGTYSDDFLAGQNQYEAFAEVADQIDGSIITGYDQKIQELFGSAALMPYANGEKSLDQAIEDFKQAVKSAYPKLNVE